ncbi:polysaccharide deacetylase family protein [Leadbettera azotonutricia]|uniref:Polysaccharide deacetylase family protein n=1 Tax=Leadbettera azotonutricia (strain ATCC BAA-888 / DSM 13862 / ZAS-9) TaxID=545695 RepID=F5Y9D0_LEAAZ|nr:polysaccharide deacetylase family protein [Leadbettera azotonutricia]AEF82357.1 polysaccharide deacetylase family protein [Leadbettera azotonutricia ZAS-9]
MQKKTNPLGNNALFFVKALSILLFLGCATSDSLDIDIQPAPVGDLYSAEEIQYQIDASWQYLGYRSRPNKYIAITFDDGPAGPGTAMLLKILEGKYVTATFFLIGENIEQFPEHAKAIFEAGHELGNHSWDSDRLDGRVSERTVRSKLQRTSQKIHEITGRDPVVFRAPDLAYGNSLKKICIESHMAIIGASSIGQDYESGIKAAQIVNNILISAEDGAIISLHETNTAPATVFALSDMIDHLRARGFWIMSVSQLAAIKNRPLVSGNRYDTIR